MADKVVCGIEPGGLCQVAVAESVEAGDLIGYSSGWKLAKQAATAIPAVGVAGRAVTYASGGDNNVVLHIRGIIKGTTDLTAGAPVYLAAGGDVSKTAGANLAQFVGVALSTTDWVLAINAGVGGSPSAHIADAPAGGTGAAAGAYDSAANRDLAIAAINAICAALEAHGIDVKA